MGEIFRLGNIIIKIWSNDHDPPHVEVFWPSMKSPEAKAKFQIETAECMESFGFTSKDLKLIKREIETRKEKILEKWREIHEQN